LLFLHKRKQGLLVIGILTKELEQLLLTSVGMVLMAPRLVVHMYHQLLSQVQELL
jgi:hypothetical protein